MFRLWQLLLDGIGADWRKFVRASCIPEFLFAVLGEMSDREAALTEIFQALKSGGNLCITEGFLDPHYQSQERVRSFAQAVGFVEERCAGNRWLFTMNFLKPVASSR